MQTKISNYLAEKLGYDSNIFQVLCGDPTVQNGVYGILVPIGTSLEEFTINKRTIRGEDSFGMFASAEEIGEQSDCTGIIKLTEMENELYRYDDIVLKLSVPTNRWDLYNVRGIARELASSGIGQLIKLNDLKNDSDIKFPIHIENHTEVNFTFISVQNIFINSDIQNLLKHIGMQSNSALQCLNDFILLDIGHPIHIYDHNNFLNKDKQLDKIIITQVHNQFKFQTLKDDFVCTGKEILISNYNGKTLCIGGIIGCEGFTDYSTNVIIEAAFFKPEHITKLTSQSAKIFNLQIDIQQQTLNYITTLITGNISQVIQTHKTDFNMSKIFLSHSKFTKISGITLSIEQICYYLSQFGFICTPKKEDISSNIDTIKHYHFGIEVIIPSWRSDIKIEEDLVEEILRIFGYDKLIGNNDQIIKVKQIYYTLADKIREYIVGQGFTEMYNFPFTDIKSEIEIINSIHQNNRFMRNTLLFNLLENAQMLFSIDQFDCKLFEIGKIYPSEEEKIGILLAGKKTQDLLQKGDYQFLDLKRILMNLSQIIDIKFDIHNQNHNLKKYFIDMQIITNGLYGQLAFHDKYNLVKNAFYLELSIHQKKHIFKPIALNVLNYKNLNITCSINTKWQDISDKIDIPHRLIDIFEEDNKKIYTITLIFNNYSDELFNQIKKQLNVN